MKALFRKAKKAVSWTVCRVFPIHKRKIVISNYYGRGYGDNLKYITDALLDREGKPYKIIWLVKNKTERDSLPKGVTGVRTDSFASIFHLSTAKVWIDNCRKGTTPFKRKSQFYLQTWHGGGAQKRCEADVVEALSPAYVKSAQEDSAMVDLMVSDSRYMTDLYHRSFWYDGAVLECGYPRYDILLDHDENLVAKVYDYYGISREKKLVLYAPTFRVDYSFDAYNIEFDRLRENLKKRFGHEFVILVHLHPNVANMEGGINYDGKTVINSTFYPDTQELIAVSSILIGDYSSINYDFSIKRMPVFRYTADLEAYQNDRDFYFSFDEYPHPYARNNDELEQLILQFDEEEYQRNLDVFFGKLGAVTCGGASKQVADVIVDYIDGPDGRGSKKQDFFERNKEKFIY